jgi:hypothetical protein
LQVNFGGNNCTALGQCILHISVGSIFGGAANIPAPVAAAYAAGIADLDLFPVKEAILD